MTNWLDPEQVRVEMVRRRDEERDYDSLDNKDEWWGPVKILDQMIVARPVLEAIAELPEPGPDDADNTGESMYLYACASYFRRIWLVARIVCGKEGT